MHLVRSDIEKYYFEWMFDLICANRYSEEFSYRKVLEYLHDVEFTYSIPRDIDRAEDGKALRYRFAYENDYEGAEKYLDGPCTILELMVSMAIRCEEIMDDTAYGDRTAQWFWRMMINLGIDDMTNSRFDVYYVSEVIDKFLNRDYDPDGRGGLFRVRHCDYDLRHVDLWRQMTWFLDENT